MKKRVHLRYSDDLPSWSSVRQIEQWALADRRSLGCRFGEPCDPRQLIRLYDVSGILETSEDYRKHLQRELHGEFERQWSGVTVYIRDGEYLIMVNPDHSPTRRTFTIAHEFGHLVCGHHPIMIEGEAMPYSRYSDEQELEAFSYGLAVLLPYAPLLQLLRQGATLRGIAHHYGISVEAVEMRLKLAGLWGIQMMR